METIEGDTDNFFTPPVTFITGDFHKTLSIPINNHRHANHANHLYPDHGLTSRSWDENRSLHRSVRSRGSAPRFEPVASGSDGDDQSESNPTSLTSTSTSALSLTTGPCASLFQDWRYQQAHTYTQAYTYPHTHLDPHHRTEFRPYDAITNCKSAGIIPYTIHNGKLYFLLQNFLHPIRKKDNGWNDFGGKRTDSNEPTAETAAREFSEETSCLFYLNECKDTDPAASQEQYNLFKDNPELTYSPETIELLKQTIIKSQQYYMDKITEFVSPIHISSKETYISYFVNVAYIPASDLPRAEDIHIAYELRYIRECKWFSYTELMMLNEKDFHKRLQITRIQQRIASYCEKGLFC